MNLQDFEKIYKETYDNLLRFVVVKCNNIDNINDIIQDTYVELYKKLKKNNLEINDKRAYVVAISKNIIKRYYKKCKYNEISINSEDTYIDIKDSLDIESNFITQENAKEVWSFIKNKDLSTTKIFYLYFVLGYKIEEISNLLQMNISTIKSKIYRTLIEIRKHLGKEEVEND